MEAKKHFDTEGKTLVGINRKTPYHIGQTLYKDVSPYWAKEPQVVESEIVDILVEDNLETIYTLRRKGDGFEGKFGEEFLSNFETENPIREETSVDECEDCGDRVEHPNYYQLPNGIEVLDIVRYMDFDLGNACKYILRASKKSEEGMTMKQKTIEDLKKAVFYLEDKIKMLEEGDGE